MKNRGCISVLEREDSLYKITVDKPSVYWAEACSGYYIEYYMNRSYFTDYSISVLKYDENTDEWTIPIINRFESTYEEMEEVVEFLKKKYDALE